MITYIVVVFIILGVILAVRYIWTHPGCSSRCANCSSKDNCSVRSIQKFIYDEKQKKSSH